jgi:hypothetical protein
MATAPRGHKRTSYSPILSGFVQTRKSHDRAHAISHARKWNFSFGKREKFGEEFSLKMIGALQVVGLWRVSVRTHTTVFAFLILHFGALRGFAGLVRPKPLDPGIDGVALARFSAFVVGV